MDNLEIHIEYLENAIVPYLVQKSHRKIILYVPYYLI